MVYRVTEGRVQDARIWIQEAADIARRSPCHRSKCGAVIINDDTIIGFAFNRPPRDMKIDHCWKDDIKNYLDTQQFPTQLIQKGWLPTCCLHAEELAIMWALEIKPSDLSADELFEGATIYFARLNDVGVLAPSGHPYCTRCSSKAAEYNIGWCLWHHKGVYGKEGLYKYTAREYNEISWKNQMRLR